MPRGSGQPRSRFAQANIIAERIGCSPDELRAAVIEAAGGDVPPSGILNITARIPKTDQRKPLSPESLLVRTAKALQIEPRDLQDAIVASHPGVERGKNVTFGVRVADYLDETATKMQYAEAAAAEGDRWAGEWLDLARRMKKLARDL